MQSDKEDSFAKKIFRFIKYNKLLFIYIIIIAVHLFLAVFGSKGMLTRYKLQSEKKQYEKQLFIEQKKTDSLKKEIEEINSSDSRMEKIAREKYGMTKEGEKIYKIEIDSTK